MRLNKLGACSLAVSLVACGVLPAIEASVCGNTVLDPGEDCDGFPAHGLECRAPGQVGQCHLDCSPGPSGAPLRCPDGYGCDAQHACRKATGEFVSLPDPVLGSAYALVAADFDGDGQDDVVAQQQPTPKGVTRIRVHYFDRDAQHSHTWFSNDPLSTPVPLVLPGDVRASLAHARYGSIGVLRGEPDGSLISEALPSYFIEHAGARAIPVYDHSILGSAALLIQTEYAGHRGLYRQARASERIELVVELPFSVADLAAEPVSARLFEDPGRYPCLDVALAARAARVLDVFSMCERTPTGEVVWRADPLHASVELPDGASVAAGLVAADFDGDAHLDLMVGTDRGVYVAYGNGVALAPPVQVELSANDGSSLPMPLAAADLSGDGRADLVLQTALATSEPGTQPRDLRYVLGWQRLNADWTEAVVADFNHDGNLDAAAVSSRALNIDYLLGTRSVQLNAFTTPTDRPVAHLSVGDFDGDLNNDLVLVQSAPPPMNSDEVSIAFGSLSGPLGAPRTTARVGRVQQTTAFHNEEDTTVSHLAIVFDQPGDDGELGSALSLLIGNSDRNLPCVVELSTFNQDGSLASALSAAVTVGDFRAPHVFDMLVLATPPPELGRPDPFELWLLPDIAARRAAQTLLGWGLPADMQPLLELDGTNPQLTARMAAGDLDGDGLDELVLSASDASRSHCLVARVRVVLDPRPHVESDAPAVIDAPCVDDSQLALTDLDADGNLDVLLAIGTPGEHRQLLALLGDGSGEISSRAPVSLAPADQEPRAFTILQRAGGRTPLVAYVTTDSVRFVHVGARDRQFEDEAVFTGLRRGTGIVAADVDGDGLRDLAVADDGAIRILRAELVQ